MTVPEFAKIESLVKKVDFDKMVEVWVPELVSGKYPQTQSYLRTQAGMCCLGVLYQASGGKWLDPRYSDEDEELNPFRTEYGSTAFLQEGDEGVTIFGEARELFQPFFASMNDVGELSFEQIAAVVLALRYYERNDLYRTTALVRDFKTVNEGLTFVKGDTLVKAFFASPSFQEVLKDGEYYLRQWKEANGEAVQATGGDL